MPITIVDSAAGNSRSVQLALQSLGISAVVTAHPAAITSARALIFPGVGDAGSVMQQLRARRLVRPLIDYIHSGRYMLAICVGAQLLLERSEERDTPGFGIFRGQSTRFPPRAGYKVPHMGWNQLRYRAGHPLFTAIPQDSAFYFVHSYYTNPLQRAAQIAWCTYSVCFPAVFGNGSLWAVQFHPEKSGRLGLQLLRNFIRLALRN